MWLEDLLTHLPISEKVAVKIDQDVKIYEVQQLLKWALKDVIAYVGDIEPNGYTDGNGISYLQITCEDIRAKEPEDTLPFSEVES